MSCARRGGVVVVGRALVKNESVSDWGPEVGLGGVVVGEGAGGEVAEEGFEIVAIAGMGEDRIRRAAAVSLKVIWGRGRAESEFLGDGFDGAVRSAGAETRLETRRVGWRS